jgi:membrane-bound lytic murein transglycosylase D
MNLFIASYRFDRPVLQLYRATLPWFLILLLAVLFWLNNIGVNLNDLILANNMDRRATVYARQTLRIPQVGDSVPPGKITQPSILRDSVVLAPVDRVDPPSAIPENIPLESLVARYRRPGPSPADLIAMADVEPEGGPEDMIAPDGGIEPVIVSADVGFDRIIQVKQLPVGIITVEVEETLGHYAEWAGVRASRIRRLNHLPFGQSLQLHQQIKIPLDDVAAEEFKARRYEFHKRLQEDFFAAYRVGELQRYRVQPGDSYWTLCREKFDLPLWLLRHYNADVNLAALKIHQPLTIPALESVLENSLDTVGGGTMPDA